MNREEMITYCYDTTMAERKRRGLTKPVPRELYENLSDADLLVTVTHLQKLPSDAPAGPWETT